MKEIKFRAWCPETRTKPWEKPSVNALNYAHDLAEQLGVEDRYNWTELTKNEVSELIDEFKDRLGIK